jgi:protein SCO1/2
MALLGCLFTGCSSKVTVHRYPLEGKIVSVAKDRHEVVIDHKAVPGFMEAMTMSYSVKDERVLESLHPGDQIQATLVVADHKMWLEAVRMTDNKSR